MNLGQIGEFGLIQRFQKIFGAQKGIIRGSGDDAAVLPLTRSHRLLFTTDAILEGHHFTLKKTPLYPKKATPFEIGWKAIAVNISDIAAMGGVPRYAVVVLGVRRDLPISFYEAMGRGMKAISRKFGVVIVGGDIDRSEKLFVSVAMTGIVKKGRAVYRSTAKVGDAVFVTGTLGGSRKGRHLTFIPRVREARLLTQKFRLTSMIDLSDGLAGDLGQICRGSKVGALVKKEAVPVTKGATFESAMNHGEDFELLFTVAPKEAKRLSQIGLGFRVTKIGKILPKRKGILLQSGGKIVPLKGGFKHF